MSLCHVCKLQLAVLRNGGKGSICCNSTVVVFLRHEHVAIIPPVGGPRVLHQDVRLTKVRSIANSQHLVVQGICCVT